MPEKRNEPRRKGWTGKEPRISQQAETLIGLTYEIGPVKSLGVGSLAPFDWADVAGWQDVTGDELTPWEAKTVIDLSATYLHQLSQSHKPDSPCPWVAEIDRDAVSKKIGDIFRQIAAAKRGKHDKRSKTKNRGG